ncbi:DsbA family protein [Pelagibius sp.]|uniref:DsbA family protein n=1 Tax=Pelagibius sp. TaxID=1931238 RepID=UPI002611DEAB|nr:DsbA family protein [Pelagibius sp.]
MPSKLLIKKTVLSAALATSTALAVAAGTALPANAEEPAPLEPAQAEAFRELVRDYLIENPDVIVEALQIYEQRQQAAEAERQQAALVAQRGALNEDPSSPVLGNPEGDVTVVEFFDYRCPYCKSIATAMRDLVDEDPNVRLVMKEFPILSQESVDAARAALAAGRQGLYEEFHFALMERGGSMSEPEVMAVAESVGLDLERLRADMQAPEIEEALRRNYAVGDAVGITGTPAMVIGNTVVPGMVGIDRLRELVAQARAEAS